MSSPRCLNPVSFTAQLWARLHAGPDRKLKMPAVKRVLTDALIALLW
jgi:hypothetical protein